MFSQIGIFFLNLVCVTAVAYAQTDIDVTPTEFVDPTRQLQNLVFYPHAHEFLLVSTFQLSLDENGTVENSQANQTSSSVTGYNEFIFNLTYGLNDKVRFGISETELVEQTVNSTSASSGITTTNSSYGPSSPEFIVTSRTIQNQEAQFFSDLLLEVTPAVFTHHSAVAGQSGDNWSSAWSTTLQAPFYWKFTDDEYEIEPSVSYHFSGYSQGPTANNSSSSSPYFAGSLLLADRYHISEQWWAQVGITGTLPYTYNSTNQGSGNITTYNYNFAWNPQVQAGYTWRPWCQFNATIAYSNTSDSSLLANGNTNQTISNQSYASVGARMTF